MSETATTKRWSNKAAFYLATIGASVGLGSIWRFPYLVGSQGGSAFILIFVLSCLAIALPMLTAEFVIGRKARVNPVEAAGVVAAEHGQSAGWNVIGILGTIAAFLIMTYYTLIAGWVLAYTWECATGLLNGLSQTEVEARWAGFLANPLRIGAWQIAFLLLLGIISVRGVHRGLEVVSRWRAPALLILLLILVAYALATGDVTRGLQFAFAPRFDLVTPEVIVAALGQAFYATGVGMAMMLAYGAYAPTDSSLMRSAGWIIVSIVVVSILATLLVFPLVFRFGMDPAQGAELVFKVLPTTFAVMPGGQLIGALFFLLLVLASLTPSIAGIEPTIAWLEQKKGWTRSKAVIATLVAIWVVGLGSLLSFNLWADWRPLGAIPLFKDMNFFGVVDYISNNILMLVGAVATSIFVGWRLPKAVVADGFDDHGLGHRLAFLALRYLCPVGIAAVLITVLLQS